MGENESSLAKQKVKILPLSSHTKKEQNCPQIEMRALTHETTSQGRWEHAVIGREESENTGLEHGPLSPDVAKSVNMFVSQ